MPLLSPCWSRMSGPPTVFDRVDLHAHDVFVSYSAPHPLQAALPLGQEVSVPSHVITCWACGTRGRLAEQEPARARWEHCCHVDQWVATLADVERLWLVVGGPLRSGGSGWGLATEALPREEIRR